MPSRSQTGISLDEYGRVLVKGKCVNSNSILPKIENLVDQTATCP
jgi:hypothetical protein